MNNFCTNIINVFCSNRFLDVLNFGIFIFHVMTNDMRFLMREWRVKYDIRFHRRNDF